MTNYYEVITLTVEEALHLCDAGKILIRVNSMREKQTLIDMCHEYGYATGDCTAVSYREYPFLSNKNGEPTDSPDGKLSFWKLVQGSTCEVMTFHELTMECDIDSAFVSDLL